MDDLERALIVLARAARAAFVARARLSDAHPFQRELYVYPQPDGSALQVDIEADGARFDIEITGQAAYGRPQFVALMVLSDDADDADDADLTGVRCAPATAAILPQVRACVLAAARGETRQAVAA